MADQDEEDGGTGDEALCCIYCGTLLVRPVGAAYWMCPEDAWVTGSE